MEKEVFVEEALDELRSLSRIDLYELWAYASDKQIKESEPYEETIEFQLCAAIQFILGESIICKCALRGEAVITQLLVDLGISLERYRSKKKHSESKKVIDDDNFKEIYDKWNGNRQKIAEHFLCAIRTVDRYSKRLGVRHK